MNKSTYGLPATIAFFIACAICGLSKNVELATLVMLGAVYLAVRNNTEMQG